MFPIGDDNSDRRIMPIVNYAFVGINILVFLLLQQIGSNEVFTYQFSLVPKEIMTGVDLTGVQVVRDSLGRTGEIQHYRAKTIHSTHLVSAGELPERENTQTHTQLIKISQQPQSN